jgi:hypothetical protein
MADNVPSPGNTANGFGSQDNLFGRGECAPNASPPLELSALADIDDYFDFEPLIDPDILPTQEEGKGAQNFDSAPANELADAQQEDPLEDLASLDRVR